MTRRTFVSLGLLGAVGCLTLPNTTTTDNHSFSSDISKAVRHADKMELYSLEPTTDAGGTAFHGWKTLGKKEIDGYWERSRVGSAILRGVASHDGSVAMCFIPRHGLRVVKDGKTIDFVICFQCSQIKVYQGAGEATESALTGNSAQETLDGILKAAGIPLAKKDGM